MADPKYKATAIPLKAGQAELLNQAQKRIQELTGVDVSRSQAIAWLCKRLLDEAK